MFAIDDAYIVCGAAPPAPSRLLISGDIIQAIGWEDSVPLPASAEVLPVFGRRVVPGFVDLHIHGAAGACFSEGDPESFATICRWAAQHGTTSLLATLDPAPEEQLIQVLRALAEFEGVPDGARLAGIHLEGPFLNKELAGAHAAEHFRPPALDELERLIEAAGGKLKHITLAPELGGAIGAIEYLRERGITVGLGHSKADFRTARRAVARGAVVGTHVPHSLPPMHHRDLNITSVLVTDDRVTAELIADGVHVHPAMVRLLVRAKGARRVALVTNSIFAAGLPDGDYSRGDMPVVVHDGISHRQTRDGALAGSRLTMVEAFGNVVRFAGVSLYEAAQRSAEVPAAIIGEDDRVGRIEAGRRADLTILDHDGSVWMTIVGGRIVYKAEE
ncbi:MAG: N-acetylglucosamine-6-phosphate deacetylase [Armatimonadetes bacterium]|nr:N-acetylglucosamine-6-phosphate deacetylase [Armatimonadota bacterium]